MSQRTPRQSLNKAFLKMKPLRDDVQGFSESVKAYVRRVEASFSESEEFHKNISKEHFLQHVLRGPNGERYDINTSGRADLVIRGGSTSRSDVKVLLEYKSPSNDAEMPRPDRLDGKATQELLLYYLRERETAKNLSLTYLVVTNGLEWYIWDAQVWERAFHDDKALLKRFQQFEDGVLSDTRTKTFYTEIASPVLAKALPTLDYTYVDLRKLPDFPVGESVLPSGESVGHSPAGKVPPKLIAAYKLFSGTHLLKLPFANDSNSLNKEFYNELLYIMGLEQYEVNNKKLIGRAKEGNRHAASLLEATIEQLEADGLTRVANKQSFGGDRETQTYEVALALVITWINRVLFCKLLEGQLLGYHNGDRDYAFMAPDTIGSYDALADLWFKALAKQLKERSQAVREDFNKIPYLNSSLFEVTMLEKQATSINTLRDDRQIPFYHHTVLKGAGEKQRRRTGSEETLRYLLQFLDAYEFGSEVTEGEVLEQPKGLINASVLGLIFEKINGYKEGSFYTPGFVTEYMCRQTIRAAILSRFRENPRFAFDSEEWDDLVSFRQNLYKTDHLLAASKVVDSIRVCDPAVGSGHFLVSALNELLAAKSELNLLLDENGKALSEIRVAVVNDELDVTRRDSDANHEYHPGVTESDRIQKTLFEQKRRLIENCLFGVDINPNSVKICRLRLWIELLKHAYYHKNGELETLPNIDINIKVGNSLVSRFDMEVDISEALKNSGYTLEQYRAAVLDYQEASSGEGKGELRELLAKIKGSFSEEIARSDPRRKKLAQARGRLMNIESALAVGDLFGQAKTKELKAEAKKERKKVDKLSKDFNDAEEGSFYKSNQAFEWRIEFPQVLDDAGAFVGFDVVVGNPPYIRQEELTDLKPYLKTNFEVYRGTSDILTYFVELGLNLVREGGQFSYIISNKFMRAGYGKELREYLRNYNIKELIDFGDLQVFDEATTYPLIMLIERSAADELYQAANVEELHPLDFRQNLSAISFAGNVESLAADSWSLTDRATFQRMQELRGKGVPLGEFVDGKIFYGIKTGYNKAFVVDEATAQRLIDADPRSEEVIKPFLAGRDIKRYQQPEAEKYLIKFERGQTRALFGDRLSEDTAHTMMQKAYPAIFEWLDQHEEKAKARYDQGEFWWELRACDYWGEFEKPKIIIPAITKDAQAGYDLNSIYSNDKTTIIPTDQLWLYGLVLSRTLDWYMHQIASTKANGYFEYKPVYISQLPIVEPSAEDKEVLDRLVGVRMGLDMSSAAGAAEIVRVEGSIEVVVGRMYGTKIK